MNIDIGTLAAFVLVSLGVLILRRTQPNLRRPFRVPWVPVIPILSIIASLVLIVNLPWVTLLRFIIWLVIGFVIYFLYSISHSRLARADLNNADSLSVGNMDDKRA